MTNELYPTEVLDPDYDDGTMPANVATLAESVVGHRIVKAEKRVEDIPAYRGATYTRRRSWFAITIDDGREVRLADTSDCCAYTDLDAFLLHPERVDHVIMGVGTTDNYTRWHVYADMGDVLELTVGWSCGNPFYYGYGFDIDVIDLESTDDS